MRLIAAILLSCLTLNAQTWQPPSTNRIDWTLSGIPGGIPDRTNIFTTVTNLGITKTELLVLMTNCPSGQVILLGEGTFTGLSGSFNIANKSSYTIRGTKINGTNATILNGTKINFPTFGSAGKWEDPAQVVSGATKGSSNIVLTTLTHNNTDTITVGDLFTFGMPGNSDFPRADSSTGWYFWNQWSRVQSVNTGTKTITIWPPLQIDYPVTRYYVRSGTVRSGIGLEDLTIIGTSSTGYNIVFRGRQNWLKGIKIINVAQAGISVESGLQNHIFGCDFSGTFSSTDGYGIQFQGRSGASPTVPGPVSFLRIENCSFSGLWHSIIAEDYVGCAILYNYARDGTHTPTSTIQPTYNVNHGPHGYLNLWEGNWGSFMPDGYHGTISHQTFFRNWASADHPSLEYPRYGFKANRGTYYSQWVANVMGSTNWIATNTVAPSTSVSPVSVVKYHYIFGRSDLTGASINGSASPWTDGWYDPNVLPRTFIHGNYDYLSGNVSNVVGELTDMPDSLIYTNAPSYWGTNRWPAVQPTDAILVSPIPAYNRFNGIDDSGGGGGGPPPDPPATPGNVSVRALGKWIEVSWSAVESADTYIIERSLNDADWTEVEEQPLTVFVDTNVSWPTLYYYRVTARNENGDSSPSASVSASPSPLRKDIRK